MSLQFGGNSLRLFQFVQLFACSKAMVTSKFLHVNQKFEVESSYFTPKFPKPIILPFIDIATAFVHLFLLWFIVIAD